MLRNEKYSNLCEVYRFSRTELHKQEFGVKKCKISCQCTNTRCPCPTDPYGQIISEVLFAVSTPALAQNLASSVSAEAESIASDQPARVVFVRLYRRHMKQIRLQKKNKFPRHRLECNLT